VEGAALRVMLIEDLPSSSPYYTSAKGCFMDCSLRVEMTWPDSINDIYIETFSMTGKQMQT